MDLGLRGKKAIVTGATKGIGRAVVELLAVEGVDIALCSRTAEEVESTVRALQQRGVNVIGEALNVREGDAYKAWLERSAQALGGCDIFIPNVSAGGGFDSEKNWTRNFEVDVMHTVRGCETLLPHLEKSGSGSIVILSSTNALETFGVPQAFNPTEYSLILAPLMVDKQVAGLLEILMDPTRRAAQQKRPTRRYEANRTHGLGKPA